MSNVPMTREEEALAIHETDHFRWSSSVELDDGRLLNVASSSFSTSDDGGVTWSDPFGLKSTGGETVGGGGLVRLSGNGVGLVDFRREGGPTLVFWRSDDRGETWEGPVPIAPAGSRTHALHDTLLRTSSGRIILPVYTMFGIADDAYVRGDSPTGLHGVMPAKPGKLVNGHWVQVSGHYFDPRYSGSAVYYSDDDGRTWQRNADGELIILLDWNATYSYTNEPTVTEVEPGKLLMLLRTGLGRLFQSWSHDDGENWTRPQPTSLAASTTPAQVRTLPNGHLLAVWNQQSEEEIRSSFTRTRLSAAISRNGGGIWEFFQNVESIHEETRVEPGPIGRVGPEEYSFAPGTAAPQREARYVTPTESLGQWDYPAVYVMNDRVIVSHSYRRYDQHATRAELVVNAGAGYTSKMKVLPLSWFYGGKEPADNPFLPAD